jgi:hypothetical protein
MFHRRLSGTRAKADYATPCLRRPVRRGCPANLPPRRVLRPKSSATKRRRRNIRVTRPAIVATRMTVPKAQISYPQVFDSCVQIFDSKLVLFVPLKHTQLDFSHFFFQRRMEKNLRSNLRSVDEFFSLQKI